MPVKLLLSITLTILCPSFILCQKTDTASREPNRQFEVNAFIKGHQFESALDLALFRNDFDLALSDSSYTLVGFSVSWADDQNIYVRPIEGSHMPVTLKKYTLLNLDTGRIVAFDRIIIKKGSDVYRAPSFVVNTTTADHAAKLREGLAPCLVYIADYKNKDIASYTIFNKDLLLESSDPSYRIVEFEVGWDREDGELASASFQGNKILVKRDAKADLSREIRPGSTVIIDNIKVEKGGNIYHAKSIVIYLK